MEYPPPHRLGVRYIRPDIRTYRSDNIHTTGVGGWATRKALACGKSSLVNTGTRQAGSRAGRRPIREAGIAKRFL